MDNKTFLKLFFFIFNCEKFYLTSRAVLCAVLEYNAIYNRNKETTFNLYISNFIERYKVTYDKLKYVLDYFQKLDFLTYDEKNTHFIITLFTLNIIEFRDRYLNNVWESTRNNNYLNTSKNEIQS